MSQVHLRARLSYPVEQPPVTNIIRWHADTGQLHQLQSILKLLNKGCLYITPPAPSAILHKWPQGLALPDEQFRVYWLPERACLKEGAAAAQQSLQSLLTSCVNVALGACLVELQVQQVCHNPKACYTTSAAAERGSQCSSSKVKACFPKHVSAACHHCT